MRLLELSNSLYQNIFIIIDKTSLVKNILCVVVEIFILNSHMFHTICGIQISANHATLCKCTIISPNFGALWITSFIFAIIFTVKR